MLTASHRRRPPPLIALGQQSTMLSEALRRDMPEQRVRPASSREPHDIWRAHGRPEDTMDAAEAARHAGHGASDVPHGVDWLLPQLGCGTEHGAG
jgi:hypothetical protein